MNTRQSSSFIHWTVLVYLKLTSVWHIHAWSLTGRAVCTTVVYFFSIIVFWEFMQNNQLESLRAHHQVAAHDG